MAAKANPIPQLPAPRAVRKAMTAVSTETEQEAPQAHLALRQRPEAHSSVV